MTSRSVLYYPPRLMNAEQAAAYFSISVNTFKALNIKPRSIGRRTIWDRLDLDRYADRMADQPLAAVDEQHEAAEVERRFLEARRGKN